MQHCFSGTLRSKDIDIFRCILIRRRDTGASRRDLVVVLVGTLSPACWVPIARTMLLTNCYRI